MPTILWLTLGGIILTIGDVIFKFWVESRSPILYVSGFIAYLIGLVFLIQSYKSENIAIASAIFVIFNILTLLLVSCFYFNEKLTVVQIVGIGFAILAILILEIAQK